ncbi:MAG: UDP-glucose 4-epimerase GalE [Magnetococcales bacterium]|nr:UDP-glucose 4-epimerase GalE [Magnetococcales bacterium]
MSTILVTGGAGYIGSHVCKALAATGHRPVTFDDLARGHREAVRWGPLEAGNLLDRERLRQIMAAHQPRAVIHCAGLAYVGESVIHPERYYHNNFGGSLVLLETMAEFQVREMVFSSSCTVYGDLERVPVDESHPLRPVNPYGFTKLAVERMVADFGAAHGLRGVGLRYFNAAGADPDGQIGEHHAPETHLIPLTLAAAGGLGPALTILGTDYPTADGTCIRDYIHVTDLAAAHVAALERLAGWSGYRAFNLSTGTGHSVRQVVGAVEQVTGKKVPHRLGDRRPGDAAELVGNPAMAGRELDWRPRFPALQDIVSTAWRWMERGRSR